MHAHDAGQRLLQWAQVAQLPGTHDNRRKILPQALLELHRVIQEMASGMDRLGRIPEVLHQQR